MTSSKNPTNDNSYFDAVLVGAGIMSSTLALLISEVLPDIKFLIIEKLSLFIDQVSENLELEYNSSIVLKKISDFTSSIDLP